ncbi:pentatricopeptide repeat-containing protein At1g05750, chloroplastic isoform X1 [Impatiens glandulifera]|uniref:pentatricopeptide repeat-containing protein At1g05750, chloroplastic isoform X1 n=1 Tax=Impatiens glandulifera TaxID=253017 RepID=UPI001FB16C78|nr:pentatricopeptide repeat-containing protein At1g05750, chloroplastic isoform X1 [Impatiens glandulifera]XP_047315095.1 pentatricopeptide repeat-containing protein At1g05750, chloroplastic isoform X1 [Impatiens glandulifera]
MAISMPPANGLHHTFPPLSPPITFSFSRSPSLLNDVRVNNNNLHLAAISSTATSIQLERHVPSIPFRKHQTLSYTERKSAIDEIQQSSDLGHDLERLGLMLRVQDLNIILRHFGKLDRRQELSQLFDWMQKHQKVNISSYSGYMKFMGRNLSPLKALEVYDSIKDESMRINASVCNSVLSCLIKNGKFESSMRRFEQMKKDGLKADIITYSTLLAGCTKIEDGYSKALGLVQELQFNGLELDSVTYGTLLAICASNKKCREAEEYFERMKDEGHSPNLFHYSSLLNAYSADGDYKKADKLIEDMKSSGLVPNKHPYKSHLQQQDPFHTQFNKPSTDPTVSWTFSISRHCQNRHFFEAAEELTRMRIAGVEPNYITFVTLLSACATFSPESFAFGTSIHAYVRKLGVDTKNVKVGTALVDLYSKCGYADLARLIFNEICTKNKVTWNTMIAGYMRNGRLKDSTDLFYEMPERDIISWTTLINGFVKKDEFNSALEWFQDMQLSDVEPDYVTLIAVLSACSKMGALGLGQWVHKFAIKMGFNNNIRINNSLIDMYLNCGCTEFACQVFEKMSTRSLVSWNTMIVGFAMNGLAEKSLEFFSLMQKVEGLDPDGISFTGALAACSHAGMVNEGLNLFDKMKKVNKIKPRIEHYGCLVDLYSRAGRIEDALQVVERMPMKPNEIVVGSLLAACRSYDQIHLAERLMKYLVRLDPDVDSNYILLSNIYAGVGSWEGANAVRKRMKAIGIQKKPGISSIEVDGYVHEFVAADMSHADANLIYSMLDLMGMELMESGYLPDIY